jgi:quinolinate synthase
MFLPAPRSAAHAGCDKRCQRPVQSLPRRRKSVRAHALHSAQGRESDPLHEEVRELARERDAVILAHNYQVPEVQDVADFVGDSLGLSRQAATADATVIAFCGVHFIAETAAILSPEKTVLIPDPDAGCSLAASITAEQLRTWKAEHPGALVVSYVNTSAKVKAESDYCCTSGNAKQVIEAIPVERKILFLPDMFLGLWLEKLTGRKLTIWMGECHVHAGIRPEDVERATSRAPDAELLVHPECGCASQYMAQGEHVRGTVILYEGRTGLCSKTLAGHERVGPTMGQRGSTKPALAPSRPQTPSYSSS